MLNYIYNMKAYRAALEKCDSKLMMVRIEHEDEKKLPPALYKPNTATPAIPCRAVANVRMELEHFAQRISTANDDLNALGAQFDVVD